MIKDKKYILLWRKLAHRSPDTKGEMVGARARIERGGRGRGNLPGQVSSDATRASTRNSRANSNALHLFSFYLK